MYCFGCLLVNSCNLLFYLGALAQYLGIILFVSYIYQAACGKPVRRAVNLGQKNDTTFPTFPRFPKMHLKPRPFWENVKTCSKLDRVFGIFRLELIEHRKSNTFSRKRWCFWWGPNSGSSNRGRETMRVVEFLWNSKRCLKIRGFHIFCTTWLHDGAPKPSWIP